MACLKDLCENTGILREKCAIIDHRFQRQNYWEQSGWWEPSGTLVPTTKGSGRSPQDVHKFAPLLLDSHSSCGIMKRFIKFLLFLGSQEERKKFFRLGKPK